MSDKLKNLQQKINETMKLLRITELTVKMNQLGKQMVEPNFWDNTENAQAVSIDYEDIKKEIEKWDSIKKEAYDLEELQDSGDESLKNEIDEQIEKLEKQYNDYEFVLLLDGQYDSSNAVIAIHAGSGGTEAQDWTEMLLRMITRFAEKQGWKIKIISESRGSEVGYKSIMIEVKGRYAYGYLKSEHGVHRMVRISPFDAEKMRHTTFALIEVLPELDNKIEVKINPKDLRIDTFCSSGAGGQSVNTAYSAVRIVHIPTNLSVSCQNERSQQQNKETAMKILKAKLFRLEEERKAQERKDMRGEYKSAEWGNQIRSYVLHPYHLAKDHRTEFETSSPEELLEGDILPFSEAYLKWLKEDKT